MQEWGMVGLLLFSPISIRVNLSMDLERDPVLFSQAVVNWRELRIQGLAVEASVRMIEADYCDIVTDESCALKFPKLVPY